MGEVFVRASLALVDGYNGVVRLDVPAGDGMGRDGPADGVVVGVEAYGPGDRSRCVLVARATPDDPHGDASIDWFAADELLLDLELVAAREHVKASIARLAPWGSMFAPEVGLWWYRIQRTGTWCLHGLQRSGEACCVQFSGHLGHAPVRCHDGWAFGVPTLRRVVGVDATMRTLTPEEDEALRADPLVDLRALRSVAAWFYHRSNGLEAPGLSNRETS